MGHIGVHCVQVAARAIFRTSPIFAEFCKMLQIFANLGRLFGLIFRGSNFLGQMFFQISPEISKTRPGGRFRTPGVFLFGFVVLFSLIWSDFHPFSPNLGHGRPISCLLGHRCPIS